MAEESKRVYECEEELGIVQGRTVTRENLVRCWQLRWDQEIQARWMARLVGNLSEWVDRKHGKVYYFVTQLFAGHGYFSAYMVGEMEDPSYDFDD